MKIHEEFGIGLKEMRKERGVSLCVLSRESGVSKSQLSMIERGLSNPTLQTIWSLSRAFDYIECHWTVGPFIQEALSAYESYETNNKGLTDNQPSP